MTRIRSIVKTWSAPVLGTVMAIIGLVLAIGGGWLIALGGSFYYLLAGIGLIVSGVMIFQKRMEGALLYLLVFLATLVWAGWEVGTNGWALVPRLVGPAILLILTLAVSPTLRRRRLAPSFITASLCLLAATGLMFAAPQISTAKAVTSPVPPPALAVNDVSPLRTGQDWPAYGGSYSARRYSPLKEINRDNVASLKRVWDFHTGDLPVRNTKNTYGAENTPLKVGDTLYVCTPKDHRHRARSDYRKAALAVRPQRSRRKHSLHRRLPWCELLRRSQRRSVVGLRDAHHRRHAGRPHHRDRCQDRQTLSAVWTRRRGQHGDRHRQARSRHVLDHLGADDREGHHRHRPPGARRAEA